MSWRGIVCVVVVVGLSSIAGMQGGSQEKREGKMQKEPRLYRVILPVGDMEKAQKFYARLLGQEGRRVAPNRHYFDCGGVILAVVDPRGEGSDVVARPNQDHVYFAVENLEGYHRQATEVGGLSPEMGKIEKRPWGEVSFYMKDPFGNPLCFVDEKTVFTGK